MFHHVCQLHVIVSFAEYVLINDQQADQSGFANLSCLLKQGSDVSWASSHVILAGSWQYALGLRVRVLNLVLFNGLVNPNDGASLEFSRLRAQVYTSDSHLSLQPRSIQGSCHYHSIISA